MIIISAYYTSAGDNMNKDLDILILTAAFGAGHNNVAKAIKEQIAYCDPSANIVIKDLFQLIDPYFNNIMYSGYRYLIMRYSNIYNYFYKCRMERACAFDELFYKANLRKISQYITETNPGIIISTFPMCSGLVSICKEKYKLNTPLVTCMTDIVDSCEWLHENTDLYLVPAVSTKLKLMQKGIDEYRIRVTGIPVRKEFLSPEKDYESNCYKNTDDTKLKVLFMGGGFGYFNLDYDFLSWLGGCKDIEAHIVTGLNKRLYEKLSSNKNFKNIHVYGFVENVAELMDNAELLISKPGGITIFEALHKHIPLITSKAKVGQEIENCKFINESNIGIIGRNSDEIRTILLNSLKDKNQLKSLKENTHKITSELEADKVGFYVLNTL